MNHLAWLTTQDIANYRAASARRHMTATREAVLQFRVASFRGDQFSAADHYAAARRNPSQT
jgi:hypothetical protein